MGCLIEGGTCSTELVDIRDEGVLKNWWPFEHLRACSLDLSLLEHPELIDILVDVLNR